MPAPLLVAGILTLSIPNGNPPTAVSITRKLYYINVYWGWVGTVLPLTRWDTNQTLRLQFDLYTKGVARIENCKINRKLHEVS